MPKGRIIPRPRRVVVVVGESIVPDPEATARRRSDVTALTVRVRDELQRAFDQACEQAGVAALPAEVGEGP
jgi:hypothetical protein